MKKIKNPFTAKAKAQRLVNKQNKLLNKLAYKSGMARYKAELADEKQRDVAKTLKSMPLQNGEELKPIMIKPNMGRMIKPMAKFPDLSGDGKVTQKDILMGKGVIPKPKLNYKK